jgi:hypothetical protein
MTSCCVLHAGFHTASLMQARKFGVRSAMPGFIARKLCPQVIRKCLFSVCGTHPALSRGACTQTAQRSCCQLLLSGLQTQDLPTAPNMLCTLGSVSTSYRGCQLYC